MWFPPSQYYKIKKHKKSSMCSKVTFRLLSIYKFNTWGRGQGQKVWLLKVKRLCGGIGGRQFVMCKCESRETGILART